MPALFALGQHRALIAIQESLRPTEKLMASHDDVYVLLPVPSALVPWKSLWNLSFKNTPGYA